MIIKPEDRLHSALHLEPGQQVRWIVRDGEAHLRPVPRADPLAALGFAAEHGLDSSMRSDDYLADLRGGESDDSR